MRLPKHEKTLFSGNSSPIQTNDDDVGSPTRSIHVRIWFGKSTLSSRTNVNELDGGARADSARHPTVESFFEVAPGNTLEVRSAKLTLECLSNGLTY